MRPDGSKSDGDIAAAGRPAGASHWLGFLVSGGVSFIVDAGLLKVLTAGLGLPVLPARVASIFAAMIVGWLMHRTFTFRVAEPPSVTEFGRFVAAASISSAVNYLVFAGVLYVWPRLDPALAVFISSVIAMGVSYVGFRFGVFRRS